MKRWCWGEPLDTVWETLDRSGLVFIPTESSYGIAVDPRNPKAVAGVYSLKMRETGFPLPVVIDQVERLEELGVDTRQGWVNRLEEVWPSPLTVVFPTRLNLAASAGIKTIAVRVPAHARLRKLVADLDMPLTATSANLSGASPVLEPKELERLFPESDGLVIDEGRLPGGPPSTIVERAPEGWRLLRVGGLSKQTVQELLGETVTDGRKVIED